MADPYEPLLDDFQIDEIESQAIEAALATDDPWGWKPGGELEDAIKAVKNKVRDYHLERHGNTCCYCRTNLAGAGPFMMDREHVLPKGKDAWKRYSFAIWNLGVACKRCNMQFKRRGDDFVIDKADPCQLQESENYRFIHPNFDRWEDHLTRYSAQANAKIIVIYRQTNNSAKSEYASEFFALSQLEIDSFDTGQGADPQPDESELAQRVRDLADLFGQ